jgi:UDP-glucose 4-epimerase
MKKVMITGASGFIGSNLTQFLLKEGHQVLGVDKNPKMFQLLKNLDIVHNNLKANKKTYRQYNKRFSMIWDDINNLYKYNPITTDIDTIYHLAASADIKKSYYKDTAMDVRNNVAGTHAVLELMRRKDIKNLIFASSSAVYGISPDYPIRETSAYLRPINQYGASKLSGEAFIHAYVDLYGIKAWMFRFAQVIGTNEHRGVIIDFVKKLNKNQKELFILGNGEQNKSYFHVSDCINGFVKIPKIDNNKKVEIYNLGNRATVTVNRLAKIVCDEIGVNPDFTFSGGDRGWPGDTPHCYLSIKKALDVGWKPKYNVEEAIRKTARWLMYGE